MSRAIYKLLPAAEGKWQLVNVEDLGAPPPKVHVIDDSMEPLEHPCDGQKYSSKRQFSEITKAHGCIEVGERPGDRRERSIDFRGRRDALYRAFSKAYDDLKAGKGPQWQK